MTNRLYDLVDIPGMGTGAWANTTIAVGTQILSERPLIQVPMSIGPDNVALFVLRELKKIQEEKRQDYFALSNNFEHMRPVEGIFKTNAIPLGQSASAGGIFVQCSRFNHSCTANAAYHWNFETGEEMLYAVKDISSGTQITVNYLSDDVWVLPRTERMKRISQQYEFQCNCSRCTLVSQEERLNSDERRKRIGELEKAVGNGILIVADPCKALSYCQEALRLLRDEGESAPRLEQVYYDAFQICVCHGDLARASRFALLAKEQKTLWQGEHAPGLAEMEERIERPESHRSAFHTRKWFSTTKKIRQQSQWTSETWLWSRTD